MARNRNRHPAGEFTSGLSLAAVFGVLYLVTHSAFWAIPFVLIGVLPAIRGLSRLVTDRTARRQLVAKPPKLTPADREKEILRAAEREGGRITPAVAALRTSCSIEEAETILNSLASKGYAQAEVLESGRLEYQFPEFMDSRRS